MNSLNRVLPFWLIFYFLALIQSSSLNFLGLKPNLIFIGFLLVIFPPSEFFELKYKLHFLLLSLGVLFLSLFWFEFWIWQVLISILLMVFVYFGKKFLTGDKLLDFSLMLPASVLIFNFINNFSKFGLFPSFAIDALFNLLLGVVFWIILNKLGSSSR